MKPLLFSCALLFGLTFGLVAGYESPANQTEIKTIRLINCPPDDILRPCKCNKFNLNYLKPEIMNSIFHNLDSYNQLNAYLICSVSDDSFNLTAVLERIYNFYIKSTEQVIVEPRKDENRVIINHNVEEQRMASLDPNDKHELANYRVKKIQLSIYGFISNSLPLGSHYDFEFDFGNIVFDYIDVSYTNARRLTFKQRPHSTVLDSAHTLILAYNQLENDLDESIDLPIRMSRLAIELNKFRNLKVLILKGNRLNHFNIPKRYLTYKQLVRSYDPKGDYTARYQQSHQQGYHFNGSHSYNYQNYKDYNRLVSQGIDRTRFVENRIEVFPKLQLLDVSENRIEVLAPTAYRLLPKLGHLNLMSNNLRQIYGRSFIFNSQPTEEESANDSEAIVTDLDRLFAQNVDDYLKNRTAGSNSNDLKSLLLKPKAPNEFYNYGTFSYENKTAHVSNSTENEDDIVNIYLGGNDLDCSKINQFAFVKIEKRFSIHFDFNNFEYLCEDLFENLLQNENLQWVNLHKNAIRCLHCGNRWLFSSKIRHESRSNIDLYERLKANKLDKFRTRLYGKNYTTQHTILQPIVTGNEDIKPIKYDVMKLANVKCVNPLSYDLSAQVNKPAEIIHLQDFNLNSFSHCNLKRKALINSLKHFALFLKAFNVISQPNVDRIDEILE